MSFDFSFKPEKRQYKRAEIELPVRLEHDGREIESTTENISCGGMFLPASDHDLSEDASLTAFITLPEGSKVVRLNGKVCRVDESRRGQMKGVAVRFEGLYDDNLLEIDRFVKWKLLN